MLAEIQAEWQTIATERDRGRDWDCASFTIMLLKSGRVKIITITKPVCSYIAAWSDKRTQYTKKENNSRILEKKKRQKEGKNNSEKRKGGGQLRALTVSLKWSLCLLWTAIAKCWSLGWGRRFSSSKMSRTPTSFASTRSGNNNHMCISNIIKIHV